MESIKVQIAKLEKASITCMRFQSLREADEAAIEEAVKQYREKCHPVVEENRSLLKVAKQKEKEAETLRSQNEQLIYALETYKELCEKTEGKVEKRQVDGKRSLHAKNGKDSKAMMRPQSAAARSSHHPNKSSREKA